jgi:hypothetical protein
MLRPIIAVVALFVGLGAYDNRRSGVCTSPHGDGLHPRRRWPKTARGMKPAREQPAAMEHQQ